MVVVGRVMVVMVRRWGRRRSRDVRRGVQDLALVAGAERGVGLARADGAVFV